MDVVDVENECQKNNKKRIIAQAFVGTACGLLFLNVGCGTAFTTILLPAISSGNDTIKATKQEISWIASICYIFQALGSVLGGLLINPFGRKRSMIVVCLPHVVAWTMIWFAQDVATLLVAFVLLGFGTGLFKSPIHSYLGETGEPSLRGVLVSYSVLFRYLGIFADFLLGTLLPWRKAAAFLLAIPVSTILLIFMIPETPIWLLSQKRENDALKSLCWLRGWVKPPLVKQEFDDLVIHYNKNILTCTKCDVDKSECVLSKEDYFLRLRRALRELKERTTIRPLILASCVFFFTAFGGYISMKANLVNIFKAFNMPVNSYWALVAMSVLKIFSAILCAILVKKLGKRPTILSMMSIVSISLFLLGAYADKYIPHDIGTYGIIKPATRGTCCGIVAAVYYLLEFLSVKTHINMENSLDIGGAFYFYASITLVGVVFVYIFLPETEGRNQEEIEAKFASNEIVNGAFINQIRRIFNSKIIVKDAKETSNEMDKFIVS